MNPCSLGRRALHWLHPEPRSRLVPIARLNRFRGNPPKKEKSRKQTNKTNKQAKHGRCSLWFSFETTKKGVPSGRKAPVSLITSCKSTVFRLASFHFDITEVTIDGNVLRVVFPEHAGSSGGKIRSSAYLSNLLILCGTGEKAGLPFEPWISSGMNIQLSPLRRAQARTFQLLDQTSLKPNEFSGSMAIRRRKRDPVDPPGVRNGRGHGQRRDLHAHHAALHFSGPHGRVVCLGGQPFCQVQ